MFWPVTSHILSISRDGGPAAPLSPYCTAQPPLCWKCFSLSNWNFPCVQCLLCLWDESDPTYPHHPIRQLSTAVRFLLNHLLSSSLSFLSFDTEAGKWWSHKSWWSLHWTQASFSMPFFHGERGPKAGTEVVGEDSSASFCCQWTHRSSSYCPVYSKLAIWTW